MKPTLLSLLLLVVSYVYAQKDTCCPIPVKKSIFKDSSDNGGFTGIRIDSAQSVGKSIIDWKEFRFTNDYSNSLRSPGVLFNEIDFSSYELLSTNLNFSDKNSAQKIVFSPFKLIGGLYSRKIPEYVANIIYNSKINVALKNSITTFGFAVGGDYSDPYLARNRKKREKIFAKGVYCIPENCADKDNQEAARKRNEKIAKDLLYEYDMARTKHVVKWSVGYNTQLFSILSSNGDDPITDSVNYYSFKSHTVGGNVTYSLNNGEWHFAASYNRSFTRKAAEKDLKMINYDGYVVQANYRLINFIKDTETLKKNENFIKTLFVPSLNIGVSLEYKKTNEDIIYAEDGIKKSRVITPYIDILLTPSSQFRIGVPFTKSERLIDKKTLQVGALIQYSFQLSSL